MKQVLIVGGGAAGLTAALAAAENGAKVTVLEKNRQTGKKLLVTGNGKCNLTNVDQHPSHYRGGEPGFAEEVLRNFSMYDTLKMFGELGIFTKNRNGYLYPYSEQASAVSDALRLEAERRGVRLSMGNRIDGISASAEGFSVRTGNWTYQGDAVILATGSPAAPQTGADAGGYELAEALGHRIIRPLPALVQLRCGEKWYEQLSGLRMDASVTIFADDRELASDRGEVQFTKNGISGIPVFQVSRYAVRALEEKRKVRARLNLLPLFTAGELKEYLKQRIRNIGCRQGSQFFTGLFPGKLPLCLLERCGIAKTKKAGDWSEEELDAVVRSIQEFDTLVTGHGGFEQAQACSGGVDTAQICPDTMESRLIPGLYFAGEMVDIDGACGGYNLQWAWSSGCLAGRSASGGGGR